MLRSGGCFSPILITSFMIMRSLFSSFRERTLAFRIALCADRSSKKERGITDSPIQSGAKEDRTPDPLLAKQVLSQLSYNPMYI